MVVPVGMRMWRVERFGGKLATKGRHVVRVDFEVVYENTSVVDGGGQGARGLHVAVDNEFEVVGSGREGDDGRPG